MDRQSTISTWQFPALFMSMILGITIGWLGFLLFGDLAAGSKITYVSQKEILQLEKARVKNLKEPSLFFGQINQAIELIKSEAQKYKSKRSKVIFTSDEFITGEGVVSISRKVHSRVIENLARVTGRAEEMKPVRRLEEIGLNETKLDWVTLEDTNKQPQLDNESTRNQYRFKNEQWPINMGDKQQPITINKED